MDSGLRLVSFASPAWSPELVFATSLCQSAGRYPPPHGISFDSFLPLRLRLRLRLRCRVRSSIVGVSTPLFFTIRARQHLTIGLATVATHDRPQCSGGLHRRSIDADPLALHETALGNKLQNEFEHLLVNFIGQSAACLRQPGMVGNLVPAPKSQEIPKRP